MPERLNLINGKNVTVFSEQDFGDLIRSELGNDCYTYYSDLIDELNYLRNNNEGVDMLKQNP